jgi:hypothetical protein
MTNLSFNLLVESINQVHSLFKQILGSTTQELFRRKLQEIDGGEA